MNYYVIVIVLFICIVITELLIKESFSSKRKRIYFSIMTILSSLLFTIIGILMSLNKLSNDNRNTSHINSIQYSNIYNEAENLLKNEEFYFSDDTIIFDSLESNVVCKNSKNIALLNLDDSTKFLFSNYAPESHNTLTFSFNLEKKYKNFNCCIDIADAIVKNETMTQSTCIEIHLDEQLMYKSENLNSDSSPIYINLDLTNTHKLSFSIDSNTINDENYFFRMITFSELEIK